MSTKRESPFFVAGVTAHPATQQNLMEETAPATGRKQKLDAQSAGSGHGAGETDPRIFAAEFAKLYRLKNAAAARRYMRRQQVPYIANGRDLFTRASWLATWEAGRAKNLTPAEYTTPRETMLATARSMVGELVARGLLTLNPGRKLPA